MSTATRLRLQEVTEEGRVGGRWSKGVAAAGSTLLGEGYTAAEGDWRAALDEMQAAIDAHTVPQSAIA